MRLYSNVQLINIVESMVDKAFKAALLFYINLVAVKITRQAFCALRALYCRFGYTISYTPNSININLFRNQYCIVLIPF